MKKTDEQLKKDILKIFENSSNNKSKVKVEDMKVQKNTEEKTIDERTEKWNLNGKITSLFEIKIESDTKLKRRYAMALIVLLILTILTLNVWFFLKGIGVLKFSDTTFNIFITGGLAEIFVLVQIIVKYLFNDNLTELLKLILDRNNQQVKDKKFNNSSKNKLNEKSKKN